MKKEITGAEFYAKYGNLEVKLLYFHKYFFDYGCTLENGENFLCFVGDGTPESIICHIVAVEKSIQVCKLNPSPLAFSLYAHDPLYPRETYRIS